MHYDYLKIIYSDAPKALPALYLIGPAISLTGGRNCQHFVEKKNSYPIVCFLIITD